MKVVLDWVSGVSWAFVYLMAIYLGVRKKIYCIPAFCICLNFSWEMWIVLTRAIERSPFSSGFISQLLWLVLDMGVLYTWVRYSAGTSWKKKLLLLMGAMVAMSIVTLGIGLWEESAFSINLIMSIAFLFRVDGQVYPSLLIAILKCLGTLPATILNGVLYRDFLILGIGGLCMVADLCYIYEIWVNQKAV